MSAFNKYYTDQIQKDLDWREVELALLRKQVRQCKIGSVHEAALLRANLAMIYAHYEGFCKFALGVYIDALEKINLKRSQLKWAIAVGSLGALHQELKQISKPEEFFTKIFPALEQGLEEKAVFVRPDHIANLWPDLLLEWLSRLGLTRDEVEAHRIRLEILVTSRNQIAHGKKLTVTNVKELDAHADAAKLAMYGVFLGIDDSLERRLYSRGGVTATPLPNWPSGNPQEKLKMWGYQWGWTASNASASHEV